MSIENSSAGLSANGLLRQIAATDFIDFSGMEKGF
jgi:hypothetical protein